MGCHFLLQGIFLTQELNLCLLCLLHCNWILYPLSHGGSWDLNSPTRDWTQVPCIGWQILNHWITTGLTRNKVETQLKKMTKLLAFIRSRNKLRCFYHKLDHTWLTNCYVNCHSSLPWHIIFLNWESLFLSPPEKKIHLPKSEALFVSPQSSNTHNIYYFLFIVLIVWLCFLGVSITLIL